MWGESWATLVAAFVVGVLGTARLTRLLVHDDWPPTLAIRLWWVNRLGDNPYSKVLTCHWCNPPYVAVPNLAWAVLSDLHWSWWLANGFLAGIYLVSIIVSYDEPPESD